MEILLASNSVSSRKSVDSDVAQVCEASVGAARLDCGGED